MATKKKPAEYDEFGGVIEHVDAPTDAAAPGGAAAPPAADPAQAATAETPKADPLSALFGAIGSTGANLVEGAARGVAGSAVGAGHMVHKIAEKATARPIPGIIGAGSKVEPAEPAFQQAYDDTAPQNKTQRIGQIVEQIAELAVGGGVKAGGSLAAKLAARGAGAGLVRGAQTGGDPAQMAVSAAMTVLGSAPGAIKAARAAKAVQIEKKLSEVHDAIEVAKLKGAVPGHGTPPKALIEESGRLTAELAKIAPKKAQEAALRIATQTAGKEAGKKASVETVKKVVQQAGKKAKTITTTTTREGTSTAEKLAEAKMQQVGPSGTDRLVSALGILFPRVARGINAVRR